MALWNVRDEDRRTGCRGTPFGTRAFEAVEGSREQRYLRREVGGGGAGFA